MVLLIWSNERDYYAPILTDSLTWETYRKSSPSILRFEIVKTEAGVPLEEGMKVELTDGDLKLFRGYIFKIEESKDPVIKITAYDQLRYFKNKDSKVYNKLTTPELLKSIAKDYNLTVGSCDDTKVGISRVEDGVELFDMIQTNIEDTLMATGNLYVLWDDFGKLRISNIESLRVPCLISEDTAGNYTYVRSIDDEFYNQIKLVYDNDGDKEYYMTKDSKSINKYGLLQMYENIDTKDGVKQYLDKLIKTYGSPVRTLTVSDCIGDIRVRGGSSIIVPHTASGKTTYHYMLVESAKHTFRGGVHLMTLTLKGGDVNG